MRISKATFIVLCSGILLVLFYWFIFVRTSKPFPLHTSKITKIELRDHDNKIYRITNKQDVQEFMAYFKGVSFNHTSSPSCPFGLPVVFNEGEKKVEMILGTDDCGFVKYGDYFSNLGLSIKKIRKMQVLIRKTGLDFDKVRW